jgi:hypothetical protein
MEMTPRRGLPLLIAGQVQKEIFHNEALAIADLLIGGMVEAASVSAPPAAPVAGLLYRVATGASGVFAGHAGALAAWSVGGWRFVSPAEGLRLVDRVSGVELVFRGGVWSEGSTRTNEVVIGGAKVLGSRQSAIAEASGGAVVDVGARAVTAQILNVLRAHGLIAT